MTSPPETAADVPATTPPAIVPPPPADNLPPADAGAKGTPRLVEAVAVGLAALFALFFWIRLPSTMPSEDDYRAAAAHIREGFQLGDAVFLYPAWAERWRVFLDVAPVNAFPHPDREDLTRVRRIWLAGLPDVPRSDYDDLAARMAVRYRPIGPPARFGRLTVALFDNPGYAEPIFDFRAQVEHAVVTLGGQPCPWDGRAHRCRAASQVHVADEFHEIEFLPRHCIWAHPAGPTPLQIRYPSVHLGRQIRIRGGIVDQQAWRVTLGGSSLNLNVDVGGRQVGALTIELGDGHEESLDVDTSASANTDQDVVFSVSAQDPAYRQFCFDATAW